MYDFRYQFETYVLVRKILKVAKKSGLKKSFKSGFEYDDYFIVLEKLDGQKLLDIETDGDFYRIPITKTLKEGWDWPDQSQIPNKEVLTVLKDLYAFLKA